MQKILSYNFPEKYETILNYDNFYRLKRRDANFVAVFKENENTYIALRDHLGTVPLYYRQTERGIIWSITYTNLIKPTDKISHQEINNYLGFPSSKVCNLIPEIKIVPPGTVLRITLDTEETLYTYKMEIPDISLSKDEILVQLEDLLENAVERTIKKSEVGLYLSGGMDSGLLGKILKKKGIGIKAYTALPWGKSGSEYTYAQINGEILDCISHEFIDVEAHAYSQYMSAIPEIYQTPNGTTTAINIAALWTETTLKDNDQVFFAQNTDTFTSSVRAQVNALVLSAVPSMIRSRIVSSMRYETLIQNYLSQASRNKISSHIYESYIDLKTSKVSQIAQAGMYIAHTPTDSEVINAPSLAHNQLCSNPYYDMNLIEFYLGIPTIYKIALNTNSKTKITFEKKLFREIACRYLPKELVYRKKGFTLPKTRNVESTNFYKSLIESYEGVVPKNDQEKVSLNILLNNFNKTK